MLFRSYVPHGPLSEVIEDFWLYEDYDGEHPHETILPTGTFEIVFNLREDELRIYDVSDPGTCRRFSGAVISGPYAASFMSDAAEESSLLGVHFKPGGAFAVLGFPAGELASTHLDLETAWGPAAHTLRERLCALSEPAQRFRLLERFLLRRLFDGPDRHGAVGKGLAILMRTHGREKIRDIAQALDLSQRRFADLFAKEVGLTPKLFGRVRRFQNAVTALGHATKLDWAQFAVECGYFDQSHLIHEFVEFTGLCPTDYWRRRSQLHHAGVHVKRHHLPLSD
jgi:AraC-like DNA-binding protein